MSKLQLFGFITIIGAIFFDCYCHNKYGNGFIDYNNIGKLVKQIMTPSEPASQLKASA